MKKTFVVFSGFFFLFFPICVFSFNSPTTEDLKNQWEQYSKPEQKEAFIRSLLLELEKLNAFQGDTLSQFLTDLASKDRWVREALSSFRGRSERCAERYDRWLRYILLCSYQQNMLLEWVTVGPVVQVQRAKNNIIAAQPLRREEHSFKSTPSLTQLEGKSYQPLTSLTSEDLFPKESNPEQWPEQWDEILLRLGDSDWHIRDQAEEELMAQETIDLKRAFFEVHHYPDPEVTWRLWHVIKAHLPSLWKKLEKGSIEQLSTEDKVFLFEHILPLGLSVDLFDTPISYTVIDKLKELASDPLFSKKIVDLLIPYWEAWRVIDYMNPLVTIFYTIALQDPDQKIRVVQLFKNFYREKWDFSFDFLWEHRLPYYLTLLGAETPESIQQKLNSPAPVSTAQCFLLGNLGVRVASFHPSLWADIQSFILDETKDKELRAQLIEHLYLSNAQNVLELLEKLTTSPTLPIQLAAFRNLADFLLRQKEGESRFQDILWREVARTGSDVWKQRTLMKLYLETPLVPDFKEIQPYIESSEPLIRSMAFTILLRQTRKEGQWRFGLSAIQYYLPRENNPSIQQLMIDQLLEETWMGKTPSKYVFLEDYVEANPNTPFKKQISHFLMQPR